MPRRFLKRPTGEPSRYALADAAAPALTKDLTAEWVTEAMRAAGAISMSDRVTSIATGPLGSSGKGMTGEISLVTLEYDPPAAGPAAAVAKFASPEPMIRGSIEVVDGYAREIHFYRDLADRVALKSPRHLGSGLTAGRSRDIPAVARIVDAIPARVQVALASKPERVLRPSKRAYALLLEDLTSGTVVYNIVNPPPVEILAAALEALAEQHARFWGATPGLEGHPALGPNITRTPKLLASEVRYRGLDIARTYWSQWWRPQHTALALEAAARAAEDVALVNRPDTLIHGDTRSDNLLFSCDGGAPVFVDWGMSSRAPGGYDVAHLLTSSLAVEFTDAACDLIAGYRHSMAQRGVNLDEADLREVILAGARLHVLFNIVTVRTMSGGYGDDGSFYDYWMPRALALLERLQSRSAR